MSTVITVDQKLLQHASKVHGNDDSDFNIPILPLIDPRWFINLVKLTGSVKVHAYTSVIFCQFLKVGQFL